MKPVKISKNILRSIVLDAQLFNSDLSPGMDKQDLLKTIGHLGYIQIDTIAVVRRAHHHVLWTRLPEYRQEMLHELQKNDRAVYEHWSHAMSYRPISDFRYSLPCMNNLKKPKSSWTRHKYETCRHLLAPVLKRIKEEGPLCARDFLGEKSAGSGWWNWKPAKIALELLFWRGDLMISERRNFQKVYDLTENVLPDKVDLSLPTKSEMGHFFVRSALRSLGVATGKEILGFMQPGKSRESDLQIVGKEIIDKSIEELREIGEVVPVITAEDPATINWISQNPLENDSQNHDKTIHLLSPFDNLIIQRARTRRIFDFDYSLECYIPTTKRKHGYFVLPLLWNGKFAGRIDAKADAKTQTLRVFKFFLEDGFNQFKALLPDFGEELKSFAEFNGCTNILIENGVNKQYRSDLIRIMESV